MLVLPTTRLLDRLPNVGLGSPSEFLVDFLIDDLGLGPGPVMGETTPRLAKRARELVLLSDGPYSHTSRSADQLRNWKRAIYQLFTSRLSALPPPERRTKSINLRNLFRQVERGPDQHPLLVYSSRMLSCWLLSATDASAATSEFRSIAAKYEKRDPFMAGMALYDESKLESELGKADKEADSLRKILHVSTRITGANFLSIVKRRLQLRPARHR